MSPTPRRRRYTRVLELARQEATGRGAPTVGTAHLVLGLVREDRETGTGLLAGIDPDALRALLPRAGAPSPSAPALSLRAGLAVGAAQRLADRRGAADLEVADVLAAVLADPDCAGVALLERLGIDVGDLWCRVVADADAGYVPGLAAAGRVASGEVSRPCSAAWRSSSTRRASTVSVVPPERRSR
jgi:ATP-dependent Clp protease ATP-binding subunit ClpA